MNIVIVMVAIGGVAAAAFATYVWYVNNVEQPDYLRVVSDGDYEVRDYPALVVAEVTSQGDRKSAVNRGFAPLASYIFAERRAGEKIAMTAPVTQTAAEAADGIWTIRFILPSKYTLETLPTPAGSGVRLAILPAQRRAAIRFSGLATDTLIGLKQASLHRWMIERGFAPTGSPVYAYYNAPFTPAFLRRNEVMFDLERRDGQ
jgi:hypothetical protein